MKQFASLFLKILISALLVYLLIEFANIDLMKTWGILKGTKIGFFVAAVLATVVTFLTNSYRWMLLAQLLDYKINYPYALRIYLEASFGNNFLPSNFGGDAIRAYDLAKEDKSWLRAASTVLVERLFGFFMMFALIPLGLGFLYFSEFQAGFDTKTELILLLSFVGMILGISSYFLWSKLPFKFINKINYAVSEYTKCSKSLLKVLFWTFITHVFLLAVNVCCALAVGVNFEQVPLWYWLLLTPAATFISFVIPAVKGVGAKEASYVYFLGLIAVGSDQAFAIGFLAFLSMLIATLPGISMVFRKFSLKAASI